MPKGYQTSVFFSSTCYDLAQVRQDLYEFAQSCGLDPVMSEFDSFPVNPNQNTLGNCLEAVRTRADLFVLIVGNRYGTKTDAGKSVTNLEFVEAQAKGCPKFVFVKRDILNMLAVWRDNPTADYSSKVDSSQLFEFVSELFDAGETWVFSFETAQDIASTLRRQISYLFADCLDIRAKLIDVDWLHLGMGPKSLKIAISQPRGWEWLLFGQSLFERISRLEDKRLDAELGICLGQCAELKNFDEVLAWLGPKYGQVIKSIDIITSILNRGLTTALGPPGTPGDVRRIDHAARRFVDAYEEILDWSLEFHKTVAPEDCRKLFDLAAKSTHTIRAEIEEYCASLHVKFEEYFGQGDAKSPLNLSLVLSAVDMTEYSAEMDQLARKYGRRL